MKNLELTTFLNYNHYVINKNLEGITHRESLMTPQVGGNCINMVMGHIVGARDTLLESFGFEGMCDEKIKNVYAQGAPPVKAEDARDINKLLKMYNESQEKVMKVILQTDLREDEEKTKNLVGLIFHEAYHAGQIGILRRVIGKEGVLK
jgi:uncharacterized damage-inducible protein DinB